MKVYGVRVEITDINALKFQSEKITLKISESTTGFLFPLYEAQDPDLGNNSHQGYNLSSNTHFYLSVQTTVDGRQYAELLLEKLLDHEEKADHNMILTAYDGGNLVRTGTLQVHVIVLDTNPPIFSQHIYEVIKSH